MVVQFRCWDGLPKCYGQILLLQTLGTRLFPTCIRSRECWSSQLYMVIFATCHRQEKWKCYSDYKAVITVPCSCFGRNEQKCHLDFDGGKDKIRIGPADVAFPCLAAHSKDMQM